MDIQLPYLDKMKQYGFVPANHHQPNPFCDVGWDNIYDANRNVVPGYKRVFNEGDGRTHAVHTDAYELTPYSVTFSQLDEAIAAYQRALALKPDFASASYNLANALLEQGQAGPSVDQYRRALQSTNTVEAHNNLGIALAANSDSAGALSEFRAALALDDRSVQAHRNLGNMLLDMGSRAEGVAHLERAVALAPAEADATYDIGTLLLQEENYRAAAERFQSALRIRPQWAEAHNNLGIALASQGQLAAALDHFERALQARPDYPEARANLDQARTALGRK